MATKNKINRKWLNSGASSNTGYVRTERTVGKTLYPEISLKIADCSRIINLDFYGLEEAKGVRAAKKKLCILRDSIQELIEYTDELLPKEL